MRGNRVFLHVVNTLLMGVTLVGAYLWPEQHDQTFGKWRMAVYVVCSVAYGAATMGLIESLRMRRHLTRISRARHSHPGLGKRPGPDNTDTGDLQ